MLLSCKLKHAALQLWGNSDTIPRAEGQALAWLVTALGLKASINSPPDLWNVRMNVSGQQEH